MVSYRNWGAYYACLEGVSNSILNENASNKELGDKELGDKELGDKELGKGNKQKSSEKGIQDQLVDK